MEKLMMVVFVAALGSVQAEDYSYQTFTNLAPCTSSRVLLMNNDTNETCPIGWYTNGVCISGQGYYDTNETTTAVGGTFWVHEGDAAPVSGSIESLYLNLLAGTTHVLYQKTNGERRPLWTLVQCRAGGGMYHGSGTSFEQRNYLPWSDTCVPIDPVTYPQMPIPDGVNTIYFPEYSMGDLAGIKQVSQISMRYTADAIVYSPFYEDGVGEIYFDVVNGWRLASDRVDSIRVEVAESVGDGIGVPFADGLNWEDYVWEVVPCDMFVVEDKNRVYLPEENHNIRSMTLNPDKYGSTMYYRVRVKRNTRGAMRFRIRRTAIGGTASNLDYGGLIYIDNIIVSYPPKMANAATSSAVVGEGASTPVTFTLSEAASSPSIYAYLEPVNSAASNLSYAAFFTTNTVEAATRGFAGQGIPFVNGKLVTVSDALVSGNRLKFFDNSLGHFVYNVRLCSTPTWNPSASIAEFLGEQLVIDVTNNFPVIGQVLARNNSTGLDRVATTTIVMSQNDPMRTFRVGALYDVDLDKSGVESNQVVYSWEVYKRESGGYPTAPNLVFYTVGINSTLNMADVFGASLTKEMCGLYKFSVRAQDKDMRGNKPQYFYEDGSGWHYDPRREINAGGAMLPAYPEGDSLDPGNDWGAAYVFELRIDKAPCVFLNPFGTFTTDKGGTPVFRECDSLNGKAMGFSVALDGRPGVSGFSSIPVSVTITPVDECGNVVILDGVDMPSVTRRSFSFTASSYSNSFTFTEFDGSWMGAGLNNKGQRYRLVAEVTSSSASPSGAPWSQLYTPATNYFRLENSAPTVIVDPRGDYAEHGNATDAGQAVFHPALGERFNFSWSVVDVDSDMASNMVITCIAGGQVVAVETNKTGSGVFSVWFDNIGMQKLQVYATDKDGDTGYSEWFYFSVDGNVEGVTSGGETISVPVSWVRNVLNVPDEWLSTRPSLVSALLNGTSANGNRTVAECYALGLDPEDSNATNDFRIVSIRMVDGKPQVEWEPKSNRWTGVELNTKVKGAAELDGPWQEVGGGGLGETALPGDCRFFKVEVVLP